MSATDLLLAYERSDNVGAVDTSHLGQSVGSHVPLLSASTSTKQDSDDEGTRMYMRINPDHQLPKYTQTAPRSDRWCAEYLNTRRWVPVRAPSRKRAISNERHRGFSCFSRCSSTNKGTRWRITPSPHIILASTGHKYHVKCQLTITKIATS